MSTEALVLLTTTLTIAFIHTIAGPDHYIPFIVIAKARNWTMRKTIWFTALCGVGHVGSSVVLGILGIALGLAVTKIELWEGQRGSIVALLILLFGIVYMTWGIFRAIKNRPHKHLHLHVDGEVHDHNHNHHNEHVHVHQKVEKKDKVNITPWILFTIFIFGPCEPLIPLVMYPAAESNMMLLIAVTVLFTVVTIGTMLLMVVLASKGIRMIPFQKMERYSHAFAGFAILLCGVGMVFFGL